MKFLPVSPESLSLAAETIRSGGLVAFPTETVYGLGADAYNAQALAKIFEVKGRPRFDPLIIHIAAAETLEKVTNLPLLDSEVRQKLFLLMEKLMPGPLSIVLPKNDNIPGIATAGLATAAIRLPANEAARTLISLSGGAVAAPSANPFGSISPTKAEHVRDKLGEKIDIILDGGQTQIGLESTVLDMTSKNIRILRPGGTTKEAIENLIGPVAAGDRAENTGTISKGYLSPGQSKSHYAPQIPLSIFDPASDPVSDIKNNAFLFFDSSARDTWLVSQNNPLQNLQNFTVRVLSESGNLIEAASRLFEILHELDNKEVKHIFAQLAPQEGLGEAINDRLLRASMI